jgi:hypothetical protein
MTILGVAYAYWKDRAADSAFPHGSQQVSTSFSFSKILLPAIVEVKVLQ